MDYYFKRTKYIQIFISVIDILLSICLIFGIQFESITTHINQPTIREKYILLRPLVPLNKGIGLIIIIILAFVFILITQTVIICLEAIQYRKLTQRTNSQCKLKPYIKKVGNIKIRKRKNKNLLLDLATFYFHYGQFALSKECLKRARML